MDLGPSPSHSRSNSPSLGCSNEELAQEPALLVLIISDGVVELMAHSNLHIGKGEKLPEK